MLHLFIINLRMFNLNIRLFLLSITLFLTLGVLGFCLCLVFQLGDGALGGSPLQGAQAAQLAVAILVCGTFRARAGIVPVPISPCW